LIIFSVEAQLNLSKKSASREKYKIKAFIFISEAKPILSKINAFPFSSVPIILLKEGEAEKSLPPKLLKT
jgi:hypothetical protein